MNRSLQEILKEQPTPADALMCLAGFVDELASSVAALEDELELKRSGGGWGEWDTPKETWFDGKGGAVEWSPRPGVEEEIAEAKEALAGCEDVDESKVLRAKIELLQDELKPPPELYSDEGDRAEVEVAEGGDTVVQLPVVSDEEQELRMDFAAGVLHLGEHFPDNADEMVAAYGKGGPLWLYYGNRDFVNGLPPDIKQAMVRDVMNTSPKEAHEMARDILKDLEPGGPEVTVENLVNTMGK